MYIKIKPRLLNPSGNIKTKAGARKTKPVETVFLHVADLDCFAVLKLLL